MRIAALTSCRRNDDDYGFILDHTQYCEELKQVELGPNDKEMNNSIMSQCRAVLGAVQWRVEQTGLQHAAKLSWLQSALPKGNLDVVKEINKLCREVYQRSLSIGVEQLGAELDEELIMVTWTDAAVGNRPDLGSTGGHLVGLAHRSILDGKRVPVNPISWKCGKLHRVGRDSISGRRRASAGRFGQSFWATSWTCAGQRTRRSRWTRLWSLTQNLSMTPSGRRTQPQQGTP